MDTNYVVWTKAPMSKQDEMELTFDTVMEVLNKKSTPETAAVFGELKGLYLAYQLAPSDVLLQAMVLKCLGLILNLQRKPEDKFIPSSASSGKGRDDTMDYEFMQGFEYFLMINGISEKTAQVYIRALKRVIRKYGISDVNALIESLSWLISEYDRVDQASHNVHISALRQFDNYVHDECGFIIAIEKDGNEEIISRIYCRPDLAQEEFEGIVADYGDSVDRVIFYDKFKRFIKDYRAK